MTDVEPEVEQQDPTPLDLRTWGLSGQPSSWALYTWGPLVEAIRAVNRGAGDTSAVQSILDELYPDAGYQAADLCLAHPPTGEFELEVTGPLSVHVVTPPDEDLELPEEHMQWDWGDRSPVQFDAGCPDHDYAEPGDYDVTLTVTVAGTRYGSGQRITVGDPPDPVDDPGVALRPATVFESDTDDDPNTSVSPEESEAQAEAVDKYVATNGPAGETWAGPDDQPGVAQEPGEPEQVTSDYDPGEHTVAEVLEYMEEHPDEADAIYDAEEAGKARVGILG